MYDQCVRTCSREVYVPVRTHSGAHERHAGLQAARLWDWVHQHRRPDNPRQSRPLQVCPPCTRHQLLINYWLLLDCVKCKNPNVDNFNCLKNTSDPKLALAFGIWFYVLVINEWSLLIRINALRQHKKLNDCLSVLSILMSPLPYRKEIKEGAEILKEKLLKYKPKIAVFNGKGMFLRIPQ